jgi:hypothetical protein
MRRRQFIALLGTVATLGPTHASAQQPSKTYLIGYLAPAEIPYVIKALKDGLEEARLHRGL